MKTKKKKKKKEDKKTETEPDSNLTRDSNEQTRLGRIHLGPVPCEHSLSDS